MKFLFLLIFFFPVVITQAQSCDNFPADCPTANIEAAQDSDVCITNSLLPQEISMQNRARELVTSLINEITRKKGWSAYEFDEGAGAGIMSGDQPVPYPLRRPHQWDISFVFIVNPDSLHAWQNWYNNDLVNASNQVVDSYKQSGIAMSEDENRQKYLDSANYYGDLKAKYMTDHAGEYQKALLADDKKGIKKYDDEMKKYDDKINSCINKTVGKAEKDFSSSGTQFNNLDAYKHKNMIAFRNASMVRVSLEMNNYIALADDEENKKIVKQFSAPTATLGLLLHNNAPDEHEIFGQYLRSPDLALLLFGKWVLKQDQYHSYHSLYYADQKNIDAVTVKKIPCDKVQTIIMHVEGDTRYINQFLQAFDMQKLNTLITQ